MGTARLRRNWSTRDELTKRELGVLRCAAEGLSREETAAELFLAVSTIHRHRTNLFRKLNANHLAHAVALAYERGLFNVPEAPEELVFMGAHYALVKEG